MVASIGFRGLMIPLGRRSLGVICGVHAISFFNGHFDNETNQIITVTINANENQQNTKR